MSGIGECLNTAHSPRFNGTAWTCPNCNPPAPKS